MGSSMHREYHTAEDKRSLVNFLSKLTGKAGVFFGKTTEEYPSTDHGCIVEPSGDGLFAYTLEGHGIGSNRKPEASLEDTIERIFGDCQRFSGSNVVTTETKSDQPND